MTLRTVWSSQKRWRAIAGAFPMCGSQQHLAAAHHKGIGRPQSYLDLALFVEALRSDKDGWFHTLDATTLPITFDGNALERA